MLDGPESAPATLRQAVTPELGQQGLPRASSPAETTDVPPLKVQPLPAPCLPPPPPSSELASPVPLQPDGEDQPRAAQADAHSNKVANTLAPPDPNEDTLVQAMEQDEAEPCPGDPGQVEMECPPDPQPAASSNMEPPPQAVPSLAAALMELHELLVSNTKAQPPDRSASCSPLGHLTPETDDMGPEACVVEPETTMVGAEPSHAEASHVAELFGQDGHAGEESAVGSQQPHQDCPEQTEASEGSVFQPELEPPQDPPERPASSEDPQPPVTTDPSRVEPEHTSSSPLPMAVDSQEEAPSSSSPLPLNPLHPPPPESPALAPPAVIDQFPAEHIQRIQAAGFSAVEAAEALERAHGVVELALLVLLARSITVPT